MSKLISPSPADLTPKTTSAAARYNSRPGACHGDSIDGLYSGDTFVDGVWYAEFDGSRWYIWYDEDDNIHVTECHDTNDALADCECAFKFYASRNQYISWSELGGESGFDAC
jgi:hypothetical protein